MTTRSYPSDCSDDEWAFVAPYLSRLRHDAKQRKHDLRHVFNAVRYVVKTGVPWAFLPHDFPPPSIVYQQAIRWLHAGAFEAMAHDLRDLLRLSHGRKPSPSVMLLDSRTLQSTPESGARAGFDGGKKRRGSKVHIAAETLGSLLALVVTPANVQDREVAARLAVEAQQATGWSVDRALVDQGYSGDFTRDAVEDAALLELVVVPKPEAGQGFVVLPKRWVVERTFAWQSRFRRLARDYERLASTVAGWHWLASAMLLGAKVTLLLANAPWTLSP